MTYTARRSLQAIPTLLLLSVLLFFLIRPAPGRLLAQAERNPNVTPEQLAAMRERLGLNKSLPEQCTCAGSAPSCWRRCELLREEKPRRREDAKDAKENNGESFVLLATSR
ncbi:MAG: hypothetical protein NZM11_06045 [Anaerolineales bacterium]|nr:hypothetical protein [Anaerolineales bacterium]